MKHPHAKSFIAVLSFAFVAAFLNPVFAQRDALSGGSSSTGTATTVTKKIVAPNDGLTVDIKQGSISYQFFATAADGSTSLVKSGTLAEPANKLSTNDLNLLDDIVIGDPDAYEIKVVVKSPQGDASTSVSFRDKL